MVEVERTLMFWKLDGGFIFVPYLAYTGQHILDEIELGVRAMTWLWEEEISGPWEVLDAVE